MEQAVPEDQFYILFVNRSFDPTLFLTSFNLFFMKAKTAPTYRGVICFILSFFFLSICAQAQSKKVKVIEIRNYLLKPGHRDKYIDAFKNKLLDTLNARGNYVLGQYRVKGENDHFVWIRGFDDMSSRKQALESFFSSAYWEKHKHIPGESLVGYTNVYLLKPLPIRVDKKSDAAGFNAKWFGKPKGVTVVDFYVANEMLDQLVDLVSARYDSLIRAAGVKDISYWVSETSPNNYPSLPVFQDKNLLVTISFFKDEREYHSMMNKIRANLSEDLKFALGRVITTKTTWILYPTEKSFITKTE